MQRLDSLLDFRGRHVGASLGNLVKLVLKKSNNFFMCPFELVILF